MTHLNDSTTQNGHLLCSVISLHVELPGYRDGGISYLAPRESTQKVGQSPGLVIQFVLQINTIKKKEDRRLGLL